MNAIEQLESAASLLDSTADMLAHLVMDTPEDQALNDQVIESHRSIARALRDTAATQPAPAGVIDRDAVDVVLKDHTIECTGPGEVTCRGCRHAGWMTWTVYRSHVTDAVLAVLPGRTVAQVKAEGLREFAARFEWAGDDEDYATLRRGLNARADELEREDG